MKKPDLIFLLSIALYSGLFYEQAPGLNFLIFNVAILLMSIAHRKELLKNKNWGLAALGALISALCITWHGNYLSLIANIFSLGLVSSFALNKDNSIAIALIISFINICTSWYRQLIKKIIPGNKISRENNDTEKTNWTTRLIIFGIPLIVVVIFIFLYRASNPVFDYFADKINLDFISIGWVMFTISGCILIPAFFWPEDKKRLSRFDKNNSGIIENKIIPESILNKLLSTENENVSGIALFVMLNILLLIVNLIDINYTMLGPLNGIKLPKGISHSQIVHQGVDALIWSIIFAVAIILYHFRGRLNFYAQNKTLKMLAYAWIVQNIFMVFSTAVRNYMYISADGITAKRIGVYYYLALCIIGLAFTFYKILKKHTNWQLVREMGWVVYSLLVLSCFINWEAFITDYNVKWEERNHKKINGGYLVSLNADNLEKLIDQRNIENSLNNPFSEWNQIDEKIYKLLSDKNNKDWRSWNLDDEMAYEKLKQLDKVKKISFLYINHTEMDDLEILSGLSLEKIYFNYCHIKNLRKKEGLSSVSEISFIGCNVEDFSGIEDLKTLKKLELTNTNSVNFYPLQKCKSLKTLLLNNEVGNEVLFSLDTNLPNTEVIHKY